MRHTKKEPEPGGPARKKQRRNKSPLFEAKEVLKPADNLTTAPVPKPTDNLMAAPIPEPTATHNDIEDLDRTPGHDAATENMPKCPIYHPSYPKIQCCIDEMYDLLQTPLEESTYSDGNVKGLQEELRKRRISAYPSKVCVGLVGDMGAGKSSLLNSILGVGTVARNGSAGTSCTWVVQEFRSPLPDQTQPFRAEIEFFDPGEIKNLLSDLYQDALAGVAHDAESDSDDGQDNEGKFGQIHSAAHSAIQTLTILFREREECSDMETTKAYIAKASTIGEQEMVKSMIM